MLKRCTVCGEEKELSEFHKRTSRKNGYVSQCKKCKSNYDKEHNTNNKEKIKITNAKLYKKDKKRILEKHKEWRDNNKDQRSQYNKEWYEANKKRKAETQKSWIQNNIEKHRANVRRHVNRRKRELGYVPLNEKFPGSVAHHIDKVNILYVPENLHKSIPHSQGDRVSMNKINELIFEWYKQGVV